MFRIFLLLGSINALLSVALGAFGAHALKTKLTADMLAVYQTGVEYQMFHALGLILIALISEKTAASSTRASSAEVIFTRASSTGVTSNRASSTGVASIGVSSSLVSWSGWLLFAGIVLFSGSLYALSLSGVKVLGAITPIGGAAFLAGWAVLAIASLRYAPKQ